MHIAHHPLRALGRATALAAFAATACFSLHAQQTAAVTGPKSLTFAQPFNTASLIASAEVPDTVGYSSSAGAAETSSAENYISSSLPPNSVDAEPSPQPPPRRYGRRPVYADSHHNADGSNKLTFFGGAGFTLPTGGTKAYYSPSYDFQFGGGRNFSKKVALLAEFDWHNFGIQQNVLNNLLTVYQALGATDGNGNALTVLYGNGHVWSFSVDPQYTFAESGSFGGYVIGGVGFYHKYTQFTVPSTGSYFDPYYGQIPYQANAPIDKYVSNAVGFNGGVGGTYKLSRFSDIKLYAEARYVYTANSARQFYDGAPGTVNPTPNHNYFDVFPQNAARTTYIPITFGIRF